MRRVWLLPWLLAGVLAGVALFATLGPIGCRDDRPDPGADGAAPWDACSGCQFDVRQEDANRPTDGAPWDGP